MEVFFHFLQQGVHRELPAHAHPFVDEAFESMLKFVMQASSSGLILRAHRRIAEFAADRVMNIMPDVKSKYGVASVPKCKRDFELVIKELARVMKSPTPMDMRRQFATWLIERLVSQVDYNSKVWYWSFLALREGIVECCGSVRCARRERSVREPCRQRRIAATSGEDVRESQRDRGLGGLFACLNAAKRSACFAPTSFKRPSRWPIDN